MTVHTPVSNRSLRVWRVEVGASQARSEVDLTLPDLAAVDGFNAAWALPMGRAHEVTTSLAVPGKSLASHLVSYWEIVDP